MKGVGRALGLFERSAEDPTPAPLFIVSVVLRRGTQQAKTKSLLLRGTIPLGVSSGISISFEVYGFILYGRAILHLLTFKACIKKFDCFLRK
jgi:hypothetical protein